MKIYFHVDYIFFLKTQKLIIFLMIMSMAPTPLHVHGLIRGIPDRIDTFHRCETLSPELLTNTSTVPFCVFNTIY